MGDDYLLDVHVLISFEKKKRKRLCESNAALVQQIPFPFD